MNSYSLHAKAIELLRQSTGDSQAAFRPGQLDAIEHLLERRGPLLVVQRTGWGKSNVYFIAAKLLREQQAGPTLIISPLLALMRNQISAAERAGVRAVRVTSEEKNRDDWGRSLNLPFHSVLQKIRPTPPQKEMQNGFQQAHNLDGAFAVEACGDFAKPVLLVDDMVDSGWTFAVCAALLRQAGSGPVFPVALAQTSKTDET